LGHVAISPEAAPAFALTQPDRTRIVRALDTTEPIRLRDLLKRPLTSFGAQTMRHCAFGLTALTAIIRLAVAPAAELDHVRPAALLFSPNYTTNDGEQFHSLFLPSIDGFGRAAFRANTGVFRESPGAGLTQVARAGQIAPGTDSVFDRFVGLHVNRTGQTTFFGQLDGSNITEANSIGIWTSEADALRLVARSNDAAPLPGGEVHFSQLATSDDFDFGFQKPRFTVGAAGHVAFHSHLHGPGAIDSNDRAIFVNHPSGTRLAARRGQAAPGVDDGGVFATFFSGANAPSVNDLGEIAFAAGLDHTLKWQGIFSEGGGNGLKLVARIGDAPPGIPSATALHFLYDPRLNNAGQVSFLSVIAGPGIDSTNDGVIWTGDAAGLDIVAREGAPAPGTGEGAWFSDFDHYKTTWAMPIINGVGHVAFFSRLAGLGVSADNDSGIWAKRPDGTLSLVAREGDPAPGGGTFGEFDIFNARMQFNGAGQIAFLGGVLLPGEPLRGEPGIWAQDRNGDLRLIVRGGQQLPFADGRFFPISELAFGANTGNEDGWASSFNDRGELVFYATDIHGVPAIYVSTLVAISEPSSASILGSGLLGVIFGVRAFARRFAP